MSETTAPLPVIPFTRVARMGREMEYVHQSIASGHFAGDGAFAKRCQAWICEQLGAPATLMTTSCTHALEMAALLLDLQPGDEVIIPTFTFVSTANAFVLRGARPVFIDVRPDTLNLDERQLERLVTPRTRAVVPVHYAGVGCEMDAIMAVARAHNLAVVEDNAHGLCGRYKGRALGTFGSMSTLSFHETKNFVCGEGGALVLNDATLAERAEILREKGTNRSRFFRGQVDKYTWVDVGSSYVPSDLLAAFLLGQLEAAREIQARRRHVWETYHRELASWAEKVGAARPTVPADREHSWHLYHLLLPSLDARQRFIAHMRDRGISAVFHYVPLHLSAMGQRVSDTPVSLPVAESASERLVRLPLFNDMTDAELERVLDAVQSCT